MTTQSQTSANLAKISTESRRVLYDFVYSAVQHLSNLSNGITLECEAETRLARGADGHFREYTKRKPVLSLLLTEERLRSIPNYDECVEHLKSDPVIGQHLNRLVGTNISAFHLQAKDIILSAIYAMSNDEGTLAFTDERFDRKWQELEEFFYSDRIAYKLVAPLPYLIIPNYPLSLSDDIVLDRLTEDEVNRCYQSGVLRPLFPRFPMINAEVSVGIRKMKLIPKLIQTGNEPQEQPDVADEGRFGVRPFLRDDLVINDVLSSLRLLKHTLVRTPGYASWTDSFYLTGGTHLRVLEYWMYGGKYELSETEVPQLLELWHLLEKGAEHFGFSIHRFNLAFDRGFLVVRIIDLVIAAESLLLGDIGVQNRGELRFRFALRAAKFIDHPIYSENDIYSVMRQAYDARSAIVHGGSLKDTNTRLPDNQSANIQTFTDTIEELVRLGLRKAISMKENGKNLHQSEYWDDLVFTKHNH